MLAGTTNNYVGARGIVTKPTDDQVVADRTKMSDAIVDSPSPRRLIVAGPGTGKSYTFGRALAARGGAGLALTFVRALVADLKGELGPLANVDTFHGYCKGKLHGVGAAGLGGDFRLYPDLLTLIAADFSALGMDGSRESLEAAMYELQDSNEVRIALDLGAYYKCVSFVDSVYRLVRHFETHPDAIPTYPLVVVDEYQDFNRLETRLIELLAEKSYVLIAGDDDQALYERKHARPDFIRALATDGTYAVFPLPYCLRCTHVVVLSVQRVIERATQLNLLDGRLPKDFEPFPSKNEDSAAHPRIIHADCSVQRVNPPYISWYVEQQIQGIPAEDIAASYADHRPTALVIGPRHFSEAVAEYLDSGGHQVVSRFSEQSSLDIAEGYRLVAADNASRLGWRILHEIRPCAALSAAELARVITQDGDLAAAFCADCRGDHIRCATMVRRLLQGENLTLADEQELRERLDESGDLVARVTGWTDVEQAPHFDETRPRIVCTSLVGSKGLAADYVFIVGFNDGDFPRDPAAISTTEVCQFIVALSRTRKACHVVSCRRFGGQPRVPSSFLGWLGDVVETHWIDKHYWGDR